LLKANPQNIKGALGYMSKPPERPDVKFLNEIKIPTLILVGEYDIPDAHTLAGVINAGIVNSIRDIIPMAGHLVPIDQPELFNNRVDDFLQNMR
jgi:3-oxoadipate enol-lactonase